MIQKLNHLNSSVSEQIYQVFQSSYRIEAERIGVTDFPPLKRRSVDIASAATAFLGFVKEQKLAAVIEVEISDKTLDIHSLTVSPDFFKQGIAGQLMHYVLTKFEFTQAIVETASANIPAIKLYEKFGFSVFKQWTPAHGIEKVAMRFIKC